MVEGRPVWGSRDGPALPEVFRDARRHPGFLTLLARLALGHRPPTGFLRDFVVEHGGAPPGRPDLKPRRPQPIGDLGRWGRLGRAGPTGSPPPPPRGAAGAGHPRAGP